jgi:hypothetical protein
MARVDDYVDMASKAVRAATARADKWDGPKSGPTAATRSPLNRAEHKSTVARLPSSEWGFNRDILHARKHVQPRGAEYLSFTTWQTSISIESMG